MTESTTSAAHLRVERPSPGVVLLTLDNPEQRNAMSDQMTEAWVATIDQLAADADLRAVVVTGEGSAFCSGGNTSWIAGEPDATVDRLRTRMLPFYRSWLAIRRWWTMPRARRCVSSWRSIGRRVKPLAIWSFCGHRPRSRSTRPGCPDEQVDGSRCLPTSAFPNQASDCSSPMPMWL